MLMTRDDIKQDKIFDSLTEAILERGQPRTADLSRGWLFACQGATTNP
jgi:hypothetical protein